MVEKGDARALGLIERLFAASVHQVEVPRALAQLERKHRPTLAPCPECGCALLASGLLAGPDPA
jgi:hypothetical protein